MKKKYPFATPNSIVLPGQGHQGMLTLLDEILLGEQDSCVPECHLTDSLPVANRRTKGVLVEL